MIEKKTEIVKRKKVETLETLYSNVLVNYFSEWISSFLKLKGHHMFIEFKWAHSSIPVISTSMRTALCYVLLVLCMSMTTIIVFLYPNHRSQFASYAQKRNANDIKHILNGLNSIEAITLPTLHHTFSQYLWCVNHYGPNNQLKDFVKCGAIAMMNNYTLVSPPLYAHYSQKHEIFNGLIIFMIWNNLV